MFVTPPRASLVACTLLSLGLGACTSDVGREEAAVVYGADDRRDYFEQSDATLRNLTERSIVALMTPDMIDASNPSDVRFSAQSFQQAYNLCSGERYASQPTAAFCSGTLIDDDLVVTAGHCVEDANGCANTRFVFGYYYESSGRLATVTSDDVYSCARIVAHQYPGDRPDYAVLQLDRPVNAARIPAPVAPTNVTAGAPVSIIGFGAGLPAKLDAGGRVLSVDGLGFDATVDAFGGNSGSGLFDTEGRLVGVLSGGLEDFVERGGCTVTNVMPDNPSYGEVITHARLAVDALCATGHTTGPCGGPVCGDGVCAAGESCAADCQSADACGDGVCGAGETATSCAADCGTTAPVCGDGTCGVGESAASCAADCGSAAPMPPSDWMCPASSYGAGDGCDCGCGAVDPDCSFRAADVHGCADGVLCGGDGTCGGDPGPNPGGRPRTLVGRCSLTSTSRSAGPPWLALIVALAWGLRSRRRRSR